MEKLAKKYELAIPKSKEKNTNMKNSQFLWLEKSKLNKQ